MYELIFLLRRPTDDVIGVKEALSMDVEKYGDVTLLSVRDLPLEQLRLDGVGRLRLGADTVAP